MISQLLGHLEDRLVIADIGGADYDETPPYDALMTLEQANLYLFEPDPEQREKLILQDRPHTNVIGQALGDGKAASLWLAPGGMASLLEPDADVFNFFTLFNGPSLSPLAQWDRIAVGTRRLDDLHEIPNIDFLKIDVQGSELPIISNGREKLRECSAVHIEIPFVSLYKNQPTFAEIDMELRARGFIFHCFYALNNKIVSPTIINGDATNALNQLIDGDAIYFRKLYGEVDLTNRQLKATALISHYCYSSYDIAYKCLQELTSRGQCAAEAPVNYIHSLSQQKKIIKIYHLPGAPIDGNA